MAQPGRALRSGRRGRRFESSHSDHFICSATRALIWGFPAFIIAIAFYQGVGSYLGNYFIAKVSLGVVHDLRTALFNNLLTLPNRYFDLHNSGHLVSRITFNVTMVTGAATDAIKVVFREGMTVIFLFAYLLWMNWMLTLVLIAILPVIGLMVTSASKKFRKQSKKIQTAMGDGTHVTSETISGFRVVRSFGGERYESDRFLKASTENRQRGLKMVRTARDNPSSIVKRSRLQSTPSPIRRI